ncbi:MAG: hypothetical protein K1V91_03670, partial [Muribaculum sp.]
MKHRVITSILIAVAGTASAVAQSPGGSFAEFRKGLLEDYNAYRKGVMERYDQFLDGVWSDFQQFKGEESSTVPKPDREPRVGAFPESKPEPVL